MGGVLIFWGHLFVVMAKGVGAYFGRVFMRAESMGAYSRKCGMQKQNLEEERMGYPWCILIIVS